MILFLIIIIVKDNNNYIKITIIFKIKYCIFNNIILMIQDYIYNNSNDNNYE